MRTLLLFMLLIGFGCKPLNQIASNEIIRSSDFKFGVKAKSGKLIIDTVYTRVAIMSKRDRLSLPPKEERIDAPTAYYLVSNENEELAIFNSAGKIIFDFVKCRKLYLDEESETIVKTTFKKGEGERSQLYNLDGELLFERDFENIGYIDNSDLMALIAEDGAKEEYYLYHPKLNKKWGPYTHFNIYGESSSPPLGMKNEDFEEHRKLNIITLRTTQNNDYVWGVMDLAGNEILPMQYKYFRVVDEDMKKRFIAPAEKPMDVNFLFYSYHIDGNGTLLFFDKEMNEYHYNHQAKTIRKATIVE